MLLVPARRRRRTKKKLPVLLLSHCYCYCAIIIATTTLIICNNDNNVIASAFLIVSPPVASLPRYYYYYRDLLSAIRTTKKTLRLYETPPPLPALASSSDNENDTTAAAAAAAADVHSSAATPTTMRYVSKLRDLVDDYDVFLLDMWGVLHDGTQPYPGVLDAIRKLKDRNKTMIILSNSSKRQTKSLSMLEKLGFTCTDFEQIITSGELSYQMLLEETTSSKSDDNDDNENWWTLLRNNKNKNYVFVFGSGDHDVEYCQNCGWNVVSTLDMASLMMARGTFTIISDDDDEVVDKRVDPDRYEHVLHKCLDQAAQLQLPLLVTNPDKVRPDVGLPPMPGRIGDQYLEALKRRHGVVDHNPERLVKRIGKPFPDVYRCALKGKHEMDARSSRVCMVGDALETDVVGGMRMGIDTIWVVQDGIHSPNINPNNILSSAQNVLDAFNNCSSEETYAQGQTLAPTILMPHFQW